MAQEKEDAITQLFRRRAQLQEKIEELDVVIKQMQCAQP
jgi:hypothetical protein